MRDYKKYTVWQKSHQLVLDVYALTSGFPKSEQFNLVSQISRAVVSIPTNIVEGCGRQTQKELMRFLYISSGSAHDLEYLILLSVDLGFLKEEDTAKVKQEIIEIKKMLASLIRKINETL